MLRVNAQLVWTRVTDAPGLPMNAESNETLPVSEKYMLTIKEAAAYFNIGIKKLRRIAEDNLGTVAVYCGNRFLIIRPKFEEFILNSSEI